MPWNTPLKLMARGFAAAVACGNTMVIKPSIVAPLSILKFGDLVEEAAFPPGAVNIVTGPGRTVGRHSSAVVGQLAPDGQEQAGDDVERALPELGELGQLRLPGDL